MAKSEPSIKLLRALYLKAAYDMPEKDIAALLSVAQSRENSPPPGVVIVSIESSAGGRAEALAAAIRAGLVNELVIDEHLAEGVDELLSAT